jgi:hypothetical protein
MYAIQGFVDPVRGPAVDMEDKPRMAKALAPLVRALQLADQLGGAGDPGGVDGEALDRLLGWKAEWEGGVDLDLGLGEVQGRQMGQAVEGRDGEAKTDEKEKKEENKKKTKKKKKKDAEKGKEAEGGRSGSDAGGGDAGSASGASGVGGAGDCAGGDAAVNITGEEKGNAASEAAAAIEKVAGKEDGDDGGGNGGGGRPAAVEAVGSAAGVVAEMTGAAAVVGTLIPTYQMVAIDGGAVTVTVELPLISGLKDMELDVSELALQLRVPIPGQEGGVSNGTGGGGGGEASGAAEGPGHGRAYVLSLVLPVPIDTNQVKAKFRRKKHHLVVTAPGKAVGGAL